MIAFVRNLGKFGQLSMCAEPGEDDCSGLALEYIQLVVRRVLFGFRVCSLGPKLTTLMITVPSLSVLLALQLYRGAVFLTQRLWW